MIPTLTWTPDGVRFIDQTKLPLDESYVLATTYEEVADVIVTMVVRDRKGLCARVRSNLRPTRRHTAHRRQPLLGH